MQTGGAQSRTPLAAPFCVALLLFVVPCGTAVAQDALNPDARPGLRWSRTIDVLFAQNAATQELPPMPAPEAPGGEKSYTIPALEILLFDFLVNRVNNRVSGTSDYRVTMDSVRRNLRENWVTDNDPFGVNQFAHPYQGAMYHGFARSAGLGYWEASAYTFAGSAAWELFGERTRPAVNDQVASGIAGSFLGESLYRLASLVLNDGGGTPDVWHEMLAAAISPPVGLNRMLFGDRFGPVFSSRGASYYGRLSLGASATLHPERATPTTDVKRTEALADIAVVYGLPGKQDYAYKRPFDYFAFELTASSASTVENLSTRGLLVGMGFGRGDDRYRGLWGLFGSYDYIAPQSYRISTTALSVGTRLQWWLTESVVLQGSALAGVGYAAVGALRASSDQDYSYGVAPQALLSALAVCGDRFAVEGTAREFFVNGVGRGTDNIARAIVAGTWRVSGRHAVSLRYLWNRRDANSPILGSRTQIFSTVGLFYTLLGREDFGTVARP
jgi:hypothetical protein